MKLDAGHAYSFVYRASGSRDIGIGSASTRDILDRKFNGDVRGQRVFERLIPTIAGARHRRVKM